MAKTVLITGASSGFGQHSAARFSCAGWNVAATMRSPEKDTQLAGLERVALLRLDVTDRASIESAVAQTREAFGTIDVLVNNAGFGVAGFLEEASDADIDRQIDTNLKGVIRVTQAVLPHMRAQQSGVIINVTSMGGNFGLPMISLYNATKFAVEGLTESMRFELARFGIRACTVAPGAFKTGFGGATSWNEGNAKPELDELRERFKKHYSSILSQPPKPFGFGDPAEVAELIYQCALADRGYRNFVGRDAKLLVWLRKLLPKAGWTPCSATPSCRQTGSTALRAGLRYRRATPPADGSPHKDARDGARTMPCHTPPRNTGLKPGKVVLSAGRASASRPGEQRPQRRAGVVGAHKALAD